jgi:MFS transporter, SP family, general alpha glucoside:H+ symporter
MMEKNEHENIQSEKVASAVFEDVDSGKQSTDNIAEDAALGNQAEKEMPLGTAFRYYKKAALWSIAICK